MALRAYAGAGNGELPQAGTVDTQTLLASLQDPTAATGFVYTYGGGRPMPEDQLGYIPGNGGRAVIFGDGSIRWIPGRSWPEP